MLNQKAPAPHGVFSTQVPPSPHTASKTHNVEIPPGGVAESKSRDVYYPKPVVRAETVTNPTQLNALRRILISQTSIRVIKSSEIKLITRKIMKLFLLSFKLGI